MESNFAIFIYASFLSGRSTLKGKHLLLEEQILAFKSRPILGRGSSNRVPNRKSQNLFPIVKTARKYGGVYIIIHFKGF